MMTSAQEWLMSNGPGFVVGLVGALVIYIVGRWLARLLSNVAKKVMTKRNVDPTLVSFAGNMVYMALLTITILASLSQLGIETTSFVAIIGAAGLAIGLALQGSLANFAAGVLMIVFRPFKVGQLVEAAGTLGTVDDIHIFTTRLLTPDNKTVIIPNSAVTSDKIVNYSAKGEIRIDLVFGIGYEDDMSKAKKIMLDIMQADERVLKSPAPFCGLLELGDSSVNFACRPYVHPENYWGVYFDTMEAVKRKFDAEGISIPYPQRDVHLYQHQPAQAE